MQFRKSVAKIQLAIFYNLLQTSHMATNSYLYCEQFQHVFDIILTCNRVIIYRFNPNCTSIINAYSDHFRMAHIGLQRLPSRALATELALRPCLRIARPPWDRQIPASDPKTNWTTSTKYNQESQVIDTYYSSLIRDRTLKNDLYTISCDDASVKSSVCYFLFISYFLWSALIDSCWIDLHAFFDGDFIIFTILVIKDHLSPPQKRILKAINQPWIPKSSFHAVQTKPWNWQPKPLWNLQTAYCS